MLAQRHNIFISSTWIDLQAFRRAVERVILEMRHYPVGMENFQPTRINAVQLCYNELQQAQIFIGIYAHHYGYIPAADIQYNRSGEVVNCPGDRSITHMEYEWARDLGLPMLLYVLDDRDASGQPIEWKEEFVDTGADAERLQAFMAEIKRHHVIKTFESPSDLSSKVATALHGIIHGQPEQASAYVTPPPPHPGEVFDSATLPDMQSYGEPIVYRSVVLPSQGTSFLATITRPFWVGSVWRKYCARYYAKHQEEGRIDREFFDLLGIVNPINVQVELDRNRERAPLTEAILGRRGSGGYRRLIVLGEPGSGKSTLLRYAAMLQAKQGQRFSFRRALIPLFLDLRFYTGGDFSAFVQSKLAAFGLPLASATLQGLLHDGRFTIYLDSLNEMPRQNYAANVLEINNFINDYQGNQFVISCRKDEYRSEFSGIHAFIQPLENEHIRRYIHGYIATQEQAAQLYERLLDEHLLDAVRNPFALFIVIQTGITPRNKASLFQALVRLLVARDLSKGPYARKYRIVDENQLLAALSHMAFFLLMQLRSQVASKVACIAHLRQQAVAAPEDILAQAVDALLLRYEDDQKLNLGFWHQSLLSFFLAQHIAQHWRALSEEQFTWLLTAPEYWEMMSMVGAAIQSQEERESFAEQLITLRQDVVGALLAATVSRHDSTAYEAALPTDHVSREINWRIAAFMNTAIDRLTDEQRSHYDRQTEELSAIVRLSGDSDLIQLVAKWMPNETSITVLSGIANDTSIEILIRHYLQQRKERAERERRVREQLLVRRTPLTRPIEEVTREISHDMENLRVKVPPASAPSAGEVSDKTPPSPSDLESDDPG